MNTANNIIGIYPILNLDAIYYLLYSFLKSIFIFFSSTNANEISPVSFSNLINLILKRNYSNSGEVYSLFVDKNGNFFPTFSSWINNFFTNQINSSSPSFFDLFFGGVNSFLYLFIILLLVIFYLLSIKSEQLEKEESLIYDSVYKKDEKNETEEVLKSNKWESIKKNIQSDNESDWKIAIMDADNLLEETLVDFGYEGETLGEILKNNSFQTNKNAWAAHKIRNQIAHNYSYRLTKQEAKRAIMNYSKVFSEFYHI